MDPDEALKAIREAIAFLAGPSDDNDAAWGMVEQLADNVTALDEWLSKGGVPSCGVGGRPASRQGSTDRRT